MEPAFTGIKNIGYIKTTLNHAAMSIIKDDNNGYRRIPLAPNSRVEEGYLLNMQLTDDYNGKHYTELTDALKKARLPFSEFKNPVNKNFLNFFISREFYNENGRLFKDTEFILNGKELKLEDKNLSFFSYIAKLVREIAHKPSKEFIVINDYLDSEDLSQGLCFGDDLYAIFGKDYYDKVREIHNPQNVKEGLKEIDNVIDAEMIEYFNR